MSTSAGVAPASYSELLTLIDRLPVVMYERRRQDGLSQRAAAEQIGITFSSVHRVESGEAMRSGTLTAILRWLDAESGAPS